MTTRNSLSRAKRIAAGVLGVALLAPMAAWSVREAAIQPVLLGDGSVRLDLVATTDLLSLSSLEVDFLGPDAPQLTGQLNFTIDPNLGESFDSFIPADPNTTEPIPQALSFIGVFNPRDFGSGQKLAFFDLAEGLTSPLTYRVKLNETLSDPDTLNPIPEPSSYVLLLAGLSALGLMVRRRLAEH
jgi:hypothetical protein